MTGDLAIQGHVPLRSDEYARMHADDDEPAGLLDEPGAQAGGS